MAALACAFVQGSRVDRDELARVFELLEIESGDVVADVGAGDGKWSVAVAEHVGPEGRVYATEIDPNDLKKIRARVAREGATNVSVVEGRADSTGLPNACCDAILLRRVCHHFTDPEAMQESLRKALRDDARLLVVDFDTRRQWNRPSGVPESRDGHGIAKTLLVAEMEDAGFELVSDLKWHNGDYALVFKQQR
jgi:ubiquinone/menaquinone biosynthesis C-methylase UbiE